MVKRASHWKATSISGADSENDSGLERPPLESRWGRVLIHDSRRDPSQRSTDGDGVPDNLDAFPKDSHYSKDANKNGLPDEWEALYGVPASCAMAGADCDGDGMSNMDEFLSGRNPMVNEAAVVMTILQ